MNIDKVTCASYDFLDLPVKGKAKERAQMELSKSFFTRNTRVSKRDREYICIWYTQRINKPGRLTALEERIESLGGRTPYILDFERLA